MSKCDAGTEEGVNFHTHEIDPDANGIESDCDLINRSSDVGNAAEGDGVAEETDADGDSKMGEGHGAESDGQSLEEEETLEEGIPSFDSVWAHIVGEFEVMSDGSVVDPESEYDVPDDVLLERERELAVKYFSGDVEKLRIQSVEGWVRSEMKAIVEVCCPSKEDGLSPFWDKELKTIFSAGEQSHTPLVRGLLKLEDKFNTLRKLWMELESRVISCSKRQYEHKSKMIFPEVVEWCFNRSAYGCWNKNFLAGVFSMMRTDGGEAESDRCLRRLRRSFVDRLSDVPLNPRFSFQRWTFLLFALAFQFSRAIFATVFARSILGDECCLEWRLSEKESDRQGCKSELVEDFPRWVKSRGTGKYEIGFYDKPVAGVNRGLKIVVPTLERERIERVFFSQLYRGALQPPPVIGESISNIMMNWMEKAERLWLRRAGWNQTELEMLESTSRQMCLLDFREALMYCVLEALYLGPRAIFMMDAYSARSFHILTEEIVDGVFSNGVKTRDSYARAFSSGPVEFLRSVIVYLILGLEDVDENNFCFVPVPGKECVRIVDFKPPKIDSEEMKIPENCESFARWFCRSPLMYGITSISFCDLESAFFEVKGWLKGEMRTRCSRFFVHPQPKGSIPLIDLLKRDRPTDRGVSFSDFLEDSIRQILMFFFVERLDEKEVFQDRCLAELFGFVGTKEEFEELCGLFSGDWDEVSLRQWISDKGRGCDEEEEDCMSMISAISRLLSLKDLLLSRMSRFDSMMTQFLKECDVFGIESIHSHVLKYMSDPR